MSNAVQPDLSSLFAKEASLPENVRQLHKDLSEINFRDKENPVAKGFAQEMENPDDAWGVSMWAYEVIYKMIEQEKPCFEIIPQHHAIRTPALKWLMDNDYIVMVERGAGFVVTDKLFGKLIHYADLGENESYASFSASDPQAENASFTFLGIES